MQKSRPRFPDLQTLTAGLMSVFSGNGHASNQVIVLDRQPNIYSSTFPSEIVTCRLDEGSELRLYCKYGGEGYRQGGHAHWGGVAYEAAVYRHVLQPLRSSVPKFYGTYTDTTTAETWLILGYLDKSMRVNQTSEPGALALAARWIGRFHAANELRLSYAPIPFLKTHDAEYYVQWVRRTLLLAGHFHQHFPWLATLCARFEGFVAPLLRSSRTIIHGEYYPENVLFRSGIIYPIDWESAAIAVGEIDLASLTDRWPAEIVQQCELEYQLARWPKGSSADFERTLAAAQLYQQFRWLGDRPEWTTHEGSLWRFEQLRSAGERLGLI